MVILIWKNVARLFQNILVQPQIIIACLGTLPLLKNQGVRVWWGAGLRTAVISSAAQWLCNWGNLKRHPYTEIHCLYQQGGKTGEVNQWNVEYGLQSDQEDIHCSSTISVGGYPDFSPLTSPLHRGWVVVVITCSKKSPKRVWASTSSCRVFADNFKTPHTDKFVLSQEIRNQKWIKIYPILSPK